MEPEHGSGGAAAESVARSVRAVLERHVAPDDRARLAAYALRHLPLEGAREGSPFVPPLYTARIAEGLGLQPALVAPLAAASCLYFAAADLADDVADGDARRGTGLDVNDACRLLFLQQSAVIELPLTPERRLALLELYAVEGLRMADGQERDLSGSDALESPDPLGIARDKSGAELAACIAAPAVAAGLDPTPYLEFGRAFGALLQVLTDYFDLFLDPTSDDWEAAKPTLPLRAALAHPGQGAAVAGLLAGDRGAHDRKTRGLWHVVQAGVADELEAARGRLCAEMRAAEVATAVPELLAGARAHLEEWIGGVVEALREYAGDAAPARRARGGERERSRRAAHAFLGADPTFAETTERWRHQLYGRDLVEGGLFGRAIACEALRDEAGVDLEAARAALLELGDPDGWRYYPGVTEIPTDADCVGVVFQVDDGRPSGRAASAAAERLLLANLDPDGLCMTWLADGVFHTREGIDASLAGGVCPGAAANALLGLWRRDPRRHGAVVRRGAEALARRLVAHEAPHSEFYGPVAVDYMAVHALLELPAASSRDAALARIGDRLEARDRLAGHLGTPLETAMAAWCLARLGRARRVAWTRALVDSQAADGGWSADPFYRTFPHPVSGWYGSRIVTTALALQALRTLEG